MRNLKGNRENSTGASLYNVLDFFVKNFIKATVNTAIPVRVAAVTPGGSGKAGYVDVQPLIQSYDGFGNAIPSQTIFKLPYSRVQGGVAALIIDPVVGDIGLAVFAQQDCTNLGVSPQKPLTKRCFSMADGFYIGGFLNQKPSIYLELTQGNVANLICPQELNIKSSAVKIEADSVEIDAPITKINGNISAGGALGGKAEFNGNVEVTQDVTAGGISFKTHTHTCPDGETGTPH